MMMQTDDQDLNIAPDDALLVMFANGSQQAAQILVVRLMPRIFSQAFHRLNSRTDAEDVAQEAFVRLWRIAPDWKQDQAKVSTWIYRVVENLCIDRLRRRGRTTDMGQVGLDPVDPSPSAAAQMQSRTRANALYDALDQLPDRQAQAIRLRHLDERSNTEIADIMGLTVDAVESLQARGRRKLAAYLQDHHSELGYQDETL